MSRYILLSILITLTSCSLPGTQTESSDQSENTMQVEQNGISMDIPKTWSGMTEVNTITPRRGSVVLAYVSPDTKTNISNNVIILKDTLENIITSEKYSTLNNLQTQKNYLEYERISDETLTFADSEVSRVYVFRARYNENTPMLQYIQTARVCGTSVYLIHFTLSTDKKPDNYITLLESFTCK